MQSDDQDMPADDQDVQANVQDVQAILPLPAPAYVNYLDKVNQINVVIDKFNRRVGNGSILGFGCEGCRGKKAAVSCRGPSIRFLAGERRVEGQGTACISRRRRGLR